MTKIKLAKFCERVILLGDHWFEAMTKMPADVRTDDQVRKGLQILIQGPGYSNLIFVSIRQPAQVDQVAVVKKALQHCRKREYVSFTGDSLKRPETAGLVQFRYGLELQATIDGLKPAENVGLGVTVLSMFFQISPQHALERLYCAGAQLPECFKDSGHYLYKFVNMSQVIPLYV